MAMSDGPLDRYKSALEKLVGKIMPGHGLRKIGQALVWKFTKEDVSDLLSQIERVKSLVDIALGLDEMLVPRSYLFFFVVC